MSSIGVTHLNFGFFLAAGNSSWHIAEEQVISLKNKTKRFGTQSHSEGQEEPIIPKFMEMSEFAERLVSHDRKVWIFCK